MSYIEHKTRVFMDAGDLPLVVTKRSEGRLRTYPSATDARAWCPYTDERRQHILDLVRADQEKCATGKYVPIEVLIDTLLASKNADIAKLRQQIEELQQTLDMYEKLDLTEEQKLKLRDMKRSLGKVGDIPVDAEGVGPQSELVEEKDVSPRSADVPTDGGLTTESETGEVTDTSDDVQKGPHQCAAMKKMASPLDNRSPNELKELIIQKDAEVISLKNALAAKRAECEQKNQIARTAIEKLETLRDIIEERDSLKQQLEASFHEIETLRSRVEDPCMEEISALEQEIERLQEKGQLTPDEEAEIIRKELQVLKKHCAKLGQIKEDNNRLAHELKQIRELEAIPYEGEEIIPPDDMDELTKGYISLAEKVSKLTTIMNDREQALQKVRQLEEELMKYEGLPQELENFRQKSVILDDIMDERNDLLERLKAMTGLNDEVKALKEKANRVTELEKLLADASSKKNEGCKALESIKAERDMLRMKVADMATAEEELERLRYRAKESEVLRIERDRLKIRLDELAAIECEFMQLLDRTRCMETIKAEREMYKHKYEELLGLECECEMLRAQIEHFKLLDLEREALQRQVRDCECCIADQEDEIKRLVGHIDRLTEGSCQQKCLAFEELQLVHTKTCEATARLLSKRPCPVSTSPRRPCSLPSQPHPYPLPSQQFDSSYTAVQQFPSTGADCMDQLMMMKKISGLENDLLRKQQLAEQKISALQHAVKMERKHIEELKATLDNEKQLNCELMNKIGTQTRAVANMQVERDKIKKQSTYHEDEVKDLRVQSQTLEEELNKEKTCCRHLKRILENDRQQQRKDQETMETMRLKLEKSMNSELALRMQLEQQSKSRKSVCPCLNPSLKAEQDQLHSQPHTQTTTFYTELTIQDVRKKRNFVHHCSTKQQDDSTPESSKCVVDNNGRRRRSSSLQGHSLGTSESLD